MNIAGLLADSCPVGPSCARDYDTGDDVLRQGRFVAAKLDGRIIGTVPDGVSDLPEGEALLLQPKDMTHLLDETELLTWLQRHHTRDCFRLEARREYAVGSDGDDFGRYIRGEAEPQAGAGWIDYLRNDTAAGRIWRKVHMVAGGYLTDYERYAFEWGFTRTTAAGEQVRILDAGAHPELFDLGDVWVLDGRHVARNLYDESGRFLGAQVLYGGEAVALRALTDYLWTGADAFSSWWAGHPQFHRGQRAA